MTRAATIVCALTLAFGSTATAQPGGAATRDEEVRFASDHSVAIAGTLTLPQRAGATRHPVVVIILGTGPWTRGGFVNIRARLLASGIATLTYDKRGLGKSTGAFVDTIPAMERDVAGAVAFLRTRRDIDPGRIALLGISQGAVVGPLVASKDAGVAAVVMLSGPVGPRGEMFLNILRSHMRGNGKSAAQIERAAGAVGAWMEARTKREGAERIARLRADAVAAFAASGFAAPQPEQFVGTLDDDVVLSMYDAAPDKALAAVRAPVLAILGS